ncbi:MAG: hypothetical protein IAA47_02985 [Candidatus Fusobacterium pullicola]|jgi:hypothetical protein|uniref:Uncharacterized protein n=1 Tax=Candidatus Fusobacterium pullicola TaxID=2838601 RepID=A0A9E2KYY9_9FUSO|nr:hypothetical protein [Candidatus Fusobacterium pullicola]
MIDEVLKIVNKFIPDKTDQAQVTIELAKLEIEDFKNKKGIITRAFHLVFPFGVFVLICMYIVEFYLRVKQYLEVGEWITISIIPSGLELLSLIFLGLLMPRKLLEPLMKLVIQYLTNKLDYEKSFRK